MGGMGIEEPYLARESACSFPSCPAWAFILLQHYKCINFDLFCRLVGAIMGTPADVVKARIMNQPTDAFGRGNNTHKTTVLI